MQRHRHRNSRLSC
uniref:Flotillin-like protein 4 n=1 Tax=Rhizophora mucronata TaxID=61149 RepID=A0A2P2P4W0_RHIMU